MYKEKILKDIINHPERHRHTHNELVTCCMIDDVIDLSLIDTHSQYVDLGTNGGVRCDTTEGPCACDAWHYKNE